MTAEDRAPAADAFTRALLEEIGHEFRTPLSSILGHQELLSEGILGELDEKVGHAVDRIGVAARQLTHLVNGAVDLAGLAVGNPPSPELESLSIAHLNEDVEAYALALAREGAPFEVRGGGSARLVQTDAKRLERVLILATTAVAREAPSGRIVITLPGVEDAEDGWLRATWLGPGGDWLWIPAPGAGGSAMEVLTAALEAIPAAGEGAPPGSWLRVAVAAVTAALIGGRLRFVPGDAESRLEMALPGPTAEV
jgi:hypothetical protein